MPTLVGVFEQPICVADVARRLQDRGFRELEIYSPVPSHELDRALDPKPSRVRAFTLIGCLLGALTGYFITIWMATDWVLPVGGKPPASWTPYTVIAFELNILFGGLLTVLGLFVVGGLPHGVPGRHDKTYDARFSAEDFGLVVRCADRDVQEVETLLRAYHSKEVRLVEA
jgi:molybdopterin-containing oxidoreductase family membrane subunit